ncbi:MAG: hypothetical protein LLF76_07785 [Planctomycetaceae bacterium]|nr:hypothetical protein [Planctomycetaceae bacterium]
MNRLKDKKLLILAGIGIAFYLGGIPLIYSGGPQTLWCRFGIFMGMAGGAIIGTALSIHFFYRPQTACKPLENNLKRKAWKDLAIRLCSLIVGGLSFYFLIIHSDSDIFEAVIARVIMVAGAIIVGVWVAVGQFVMKKRILNGLDERQRVMYEKAKMISDSIFGGLWVAGLMGLWGWLGLKTSVPIFVPVLLLIGLGFIAEISHPLIILIQCKREQK